MLCLFFATFRFDDVTLSADFTLQYFSATPPPHAITHSYYFAIAAYAFRLIRF